MSTPRRKRGEVPLSTGVFNPYEQKSTRTMVDQHIYKEVLVSPDVMEAILGSSEEEELEAYKKDMQGQLLEYLLENLPNILTTKQMTVLSKLMTGNKSQQDIADEMGVHQTTIHKLLHGNITYSVTKSVKDPITKKRKDVKVQLAQPKRYGGLMSKIKHWVESDETASQLAKEAGLL